MLKALLVSLIFSTAPVLADAPFVAPAGPEMFSHGDAPVMWFGASNCGDIVLWLVFPDGHIVRIDADHHPKDMKAFMGSLEEVPHDIVLLDCKTHEGTA